MGLLTACIKSFQEVRQDAKSSPLLRGCLALIVLYPVWSAGGTALDYHYGRYLQRRNKRLQRAKACGARIAVDVDKEKAENADWQKEFLVALAQALDVIETRLSIQGIEEGHGNTFVRVWFRRAEESAGKNADSAPCDKLWHQVKLEIQKRQGKGVAGPLSIIKDVTVDGAKGRGDDEAKVYSLWLCPSKQSKTSCDEAIKKLSEKFKSPKFDPHLTLLGAVECDLEDINNVAEKLATQTEAFQVSFSKVHVGSTYHRSLFLEAVLSDEVHALHMKSREFSKASLLPKAFGGQSCKWLDTQTPNSGFYPHLSLAYLETPLDDTSSVADICPTELLAKASFRADEVQVWETDVADRTCKSWKQVSSFKFEGKKPISFGSLLQRFSGVAAPQFAQIAVGMALNIAGGIFCDMACKGDMDLYTGKHVGKSNQEIMQVLFNGLALWGAVHQCHTWAYAISRKAGTQIGARLKEGLFNSLITQDVKWIQKKGAEDLYKTLNERSSNVERMFTDEIPGAIRMVTDFIRNLGNLWISRPRMFVFGVGMFAFQNISSGFFGSIIRVARDHDEETEKVKDNSLEVLQNFRIVRAFAREDKEKKTYGKSLGQQLAVRRSDFVEKLTDTGQWFTYEFTYQFAYLYGGMLVNSGYLVADEVKDIVSKTFRATWDLQRLQWRLQNKSTFPQDAAAVLEALERPPEIPFEDDTKYNPAPHDVRGEIEAIGMNMSYAEDTGEPVLKDMNFKIAAGSMVGLVGPSGCGKSTLFNTLLRFYDYSQGSLKIDGRELRDWNPQALYRAVAWVSQDQAVFNGTVLDNIRYGVPEASESDVLRVMKEAALYDDVMKKEKGVLTDASELSGGQKQRLSIARALLRNPKLLLLDEATSALDTASERQVQKAFDTLMKGRTVIAIAHRLSTIMNSDQILVMEAGKIIESGSHAELMKKAEGKYADLVRQCTANDDDSAKTETSKDPQAVQDASFSLAQLREKVPEELREDVEKALSTLKDAAATLKSEKKRLAMREKMMLGLSSKWSAAKGTVKAVTRFRTIAAAMGADKIQQPPPVLERAQSNASRSGNEDDQAPALLSLDRCESAPH